jgi:hypothetical protein
MAIYMKTNRGASFPIMAVVTTKAKKGWGNFISFNCCCHNKGQKNGGTLFPLIVVVTIIDKEKEGDKIHLGGWHDEKNKKKGWGEENSLPWLV